MSNEGFRCPSCNGGRTLAINRRERKRRRECRDCGHRFTTVELTEGEYTAMQSEIEALKAVREAISNVVK